MATPDASRKRLNKDAPRSCNQKDYVPTRTEEMVRRVKALARAAIPETASHFASTAPLPRIGNSHSRKATSGPAWDVVMPASTQPRYFDRQPLPSITAAPAGSFRMQAVEAVALRKDDLEDSKLRGISDRGKYLKQLHDDAARARTKQTKHCRAVAQQVRLTSLAAHDEAAMRLALQTEERGDFNHIYRIFTTDSLVLKTRESGNLHTTQNGDDAVSPNRPFMRPSGPQEFLKKANTVYSGHAIRLPAVTNLSKSHYNHRLPEGATVDVLPPMLSYEARLCTVREGQRRYKQMILEADEWKCMLLNFASMSRMFDELGRIGVAAPPAHGSGSANPPSPMSSKARSKSEKHKSDNNHPATTPAAGRESEKPDKSLSKAMQAPAEQSASSDKRRKAKPEKQSSKAVTSDAEKASPADAQTPPQSSENETPAINGTQTTSGNGSRPTAEDPAATANIAEDGNTPEAQQRAADAAADAAWMWTAADTDMVIANAVEEVSSARGTQSAAPPVAEVTKSEAVPGSEPMPETTALTEPVSLEQTSQESSPPPAVAA
jgi:hypothetical protein